MLHILLHELKYYFKNAHELIYIYGFFVLIFLLFPMGMKGELHAMHELLPVMVSMAVMLSISLGAMPLFQRDVESGVMDTYQQLPLGLYAVVLGKWLAYYLAATLPLVLSLPAMLALAGTGQGALVHYAAGVVAMAAAISIIAALAAVITAGLDRARAIILLITMPIAIPVIIFASAYFRAAGEAVWQPSLMFLVAFSIFLLPCLCMAGAGCLKASN